MDSLPEVKYWLRNIPRHPASFWLPLEGGKSYPDFVALLNDGRFLVVEYKGGDRVKNPDTAAKAAVGHLWEKAGGGLFMMVEKQADDLDMRGPMRRKISGG